MREELTSDGKAPADPDDEGSYDSDDFPKGPYADDGGEADCPQHCDHCNVFLENELTEDGLNYVIELIERAEETERNGGGKNDVTEEWREFYGIQTRVEHLGDAAHDERDQT